MSVLSFRYEGATTERHGMQHGCAGDEVYEDDRGVGILDKIACVCGVWRERRTEGCVWNAGLAMRWWLDSDNVL